MASIKLKGDTSGEVTISAPAVAGTTTLELPATSSTLATQNALGVRNLIINGDMRIDQRNSGSAVTNLRNLPVYTVDRFAYRRGGTWTTAYFQHQQDTDVPSGYGFSHSLKFSCTATETPLANMHSYICGHNIEGYNIAHLEWGTANAKTVTLSFWVKSNKTGQYGFFIDTLDEDYIGSYTINSANTWEKKTIVIDGPTSGSFETGNGSGLHILWFASVGPDLKSTTATENAWQTFDETKRAYFHQVDLADSTSNYINITGVQLEVGDTATPFEHRPYDMELARCQRYYYLHADGSGRALGNGTMYTASLGYIFVHLPVTLRANPALEVTNFTSMRVFQNNGFANPTDMTIWTSYNPNVGGLRTVVSRSVGSVFMDNGGSGDNIIAFDAEL
jgi:hypothetical protein